MNAAASPRRRLARIASAGRLLLHEPWLQKSGFVLFRRPCAQPGTITPLPAYAQYELEIAESAGQVETWRNDGRDFVDGRVYVDIRQNFAPGVRFYCWFHAGTLVHWSRMTTDVRDANFKNLFAPDAEGRGVYLGPCYTNPAYRGQHIYGFTLEKICEDSAAAGATEAYIYTRPENPKSFSGITRAGFEHFATVTQRRFLIWSSWSRTDAPTDNT
jgi:hypothetical protein